MILVTDEVGIACPENQTLSAEILRHFLLAREIRIEQLLIPIMSAKSLKKIIFNFKLWKIIVFVTNESRKGNSEMPHTRYISQETI